MMIGHLTFAGLAEAVISAGLVAYLQVADPALLRATSGILNETSDAAMTERPATRSLQTPWIAIAALMLLTPLGILAGGTAWGEWSPAQMAKAPAQTTSSRRNPYPSGLQRLSNLWTAPFPAYAPSFVRSRGFGYLLSAMFGVGVLLAVSLVLRLLLQRHRQKEYSA